MNIPDGSPKYNDLIDIIVESAKQTKQKRLVDGTYEDVISVDSEIVWWKTGSINSPSFSRMAFELKEWERQADLALTHMTKNRAEQMAGEIRGIGVSYRRSIDAKSSENMRDKQNSQSTLIDKINRNKVEKVYTAKGELKRSALDAIMGRDKAKDNEND